MKRTVGNLLLFINLAVFLAGTTGISFSLHECKSSQKREIFLFPEILNHNSSCCCAEEVHGSGLSEETDKSFNEPECCKNSHVYLKASYIGFPVFYKFNSDHFQKILPSELAELHDCNHSPEINPDQPRIDHPPPRSGRLLVQFLQQIKIPAPVS